MIVGLEGIGSVRSRQADGDSPGTSGRAESCRCIFEDDERLSGHPELGCRRGVRLRVRLSERHIIRGDDDIGGTQAGSAEPTAPNGKTGQITMFVLLFTFLSAVTLLMWRHSRRDNASPRRIGRRI